MAEAIRAAIAETQWHFDAYSDLLKRLGEQQLCSINEISENVQIVHYFIREYSMEVQFDISHEANSS